MKSLIIFLLLFITGCASQTILFSDVEKIIKINCNIYADTLNTFENFYFSSKSETQEHKVPFYFNSEEQQKIIDEVNRNNFFDLPDTIIRYIHKPDEQGVVQVIVNFHSRFCEIELGGKKNLSLWIESTFLIMKNL